MQKVRGWRLEAKEKIKGNYDFASSEAVLKRSAP
jgi:hypothetical protein